MGMFDWVNFKVACPVCKTEISGFQTKDSDCNLETKEIYEIDRFYSSCRNCHTWVEYERKEGHKKVSTELLLESKNLLQKVLAEDSSSVKGQIADYLNRCDPNIQDEVAANFHLTYRKLED
jgi:hypothetical protein